MTESDMGQSEVLITEGTRSDSQRKGSGGAKTFAGRSPGNKGVAILPADQAKTKSKKKQMQEQEQGGCA